MDSLAPYRLFFAKLVTAHAGIAPGSLIEAAFASTPREKFVGPPPWKVFTRGGYITVPGSDPALLYQDVVVSLGVEAPLNNGQPALHAQCLNALHLRAGEHVVHIGAGSGYYTMILGRLVGAEGRVDAYEIAPELARRARESLAEMPQVTVHARSGAEGQLPACDAIYVNAAASEPLPCWLDALKPGGRLLFPLSAAQSSGAMLLISRTDKPGKYAARFLVPAQFVPCTGAQDESTWPALNDAFAHGRWQEVRWLYRGGAPDSSAWYAGKNWWLAK